MVDLRGWEIFSRLPQTPPPHLLLVAFPDKTLSSLAAAGRQLVLLFFPLQFFPLKWQVGSIHVPSLSGRHQSRHPHPCHHWTAPWPRTTWDDEDTHDHASPGTKLWPVILGIEISPSAPSLAAGAVRQTDHSPWRGPVLPSPRVGDDLPWQANHWVSSISSAPSPILQTFDRDRSSFLHSHSRLLKLVAVAWEVWARLASPVAATFPSPPSAKPSQESIPSPSMPCRLRHHSQPLFSGRPPRCQDLPPTGESNPIPETLPAIRTDGDIDAARRIRT